MSHLCWPLIFLLLRQSQDEAAQMSAFPDTVPSAELQCILLLTPASPAAGRGSSVTGLCLLWCTGCLPELLGIPSSLLLQSPTVDLTLLESTLVVYRQWKTGAPGRNKVYNYPWKYRAQRKENVRTTYPITWKDAYHPHYVHRQG